MCVPLNVTAHRVAHKFTMANAPVDGGEFACNPVCMLRRTKDTSDKSWIEVF